MRNPKRIEPMLSLIRKIWTHHPDLRLMQLLMNALKMNRDPYYVEDDDLQKALEKDKKTYVRGTKS